jgi:uncharacterized protein (DUF58 family)
VNALGALRALTLRGRCFIAAGLAMVGCGAGFGEKDLIRAGILVFALPLAAAIVVARTRFRLSCTRRLRPSRVPVDATTEVTLRLVNLSGRSTGLLLVEDGLPGVLGPRPRFVLDRVEGHGVRDVSYPVRGEVRGRYRIGPLVVRLADPFGMVALAWPFSSYDELIVTPAIEQLPPARLAGPSRGGGDARARVAAAAAGEDDVVPRKYRRGDELRRVDWRSTARRGELMVRREEQPSQPSGALLLDTRAAAHSGPGPGSSFEWAVSATASVGCQLARARFELRLVTDTGEHLGASGAAFTDLLLDRLATLRPSGRSALATGLAALRSSSGAGLVVAVIGPGSSAEIDSLARVIRGGTAGIAVLLDTASWDEQGSLATDGQLAAAEARLRRGGWRVLAVRSGVSLAQLWPAAAGGDPMPVRDTAPPLDVVGRRAS